MSPALHPARLDFAADGTPFSTLFDDIYHSSDGGPGQARHVFLHGNGLPDRWAGRQQFVILENGFGSGLNFLSTWAAWRDDPGRPDKLHYLATELHPLRVADLERVHRSWKPLEYLAEALRNVWPLPISGMHRLEFAAGRVVLTLLFGDALASLRQLRTSVDAFYLDGFDPNRNPQMWSSGIIRRCAQLAAPGATFATWCVAGQVRRALGEAGFVPEKRPGFGSKRQMLAGRLGPRRHPAPPAPPLVDRHAVVIGAGLAGCAIAERLASRGWQVDLFDRATAAASAASGNLAGIVRPLLSRDDNLASRLNRACFLYLERAMRRLDQAGFPPRRGCNGLLQIAPDAEDEIRWRGLLAASAFPDSFARFVDRTAAAQLLGAQTQHGGCWFPAGGWASPASLCRAWLAIGRAGIRLHGGQAISGLRRIDQGWVLLADDERVVASAPLVVLATGAHPALTPFPQIAGLPIQPVRGQVSHLPAGKLPNPRHAACGDGYLTPAVDDVHCLGASYAKDASDVIRPSEHAENLQRLAHLLPGTELAFDPHGLQGRVGFRATTPDHLPLVGALPDHAAPLPDDLRLSTFPRHPGLYGLLGLGSRGLVWAALLAEHLACLINQEPLPLPGDQTDAIDPARFALRSHRRST